MVGESIHNVKQLIINNYIKKILLEIRLQQNSRRIALNALISVLDHGNTLDQALNDAHDYDLLSKSDRAFVRLILLTTLRHLGEIDKLISTFIKKSLSPRHIRASHIMRITAAQLLFLDTPPYAAVSSAVNLAGTDQSTFPLKGLVNAVLRKLSKVGKTRLKEIDSERVNIPDWLWKKLNAEYGENITREIFKANCRPAPLDLTLKNPSKVEEWSKRLNAYVLPNKSLRLSNYGRIEDLEGFYEGEWWVQDAAASFPARMIDNSLNYEIADLCAAPGGKTAQLAALGAKVTAVDESKTRIKRLIENLSRLNLDVVLVEQDILKWTPLNELKQVLLDAPCSATGTIRRHPEVPWTRTPPDLERLKLKQDAMLDAVTDIVSPGGKIVYTVCSLLPEEGVERINALLSRKPNISREKFDLISLGAPPSAINKYGDLQTLPCHWKKYDGLDGFFATCLRRRQ